MQRGPRELAMFWIADRANRERRNVSRAPRWFIVFGQNTPPSFNRPCEWNLRHVRRHPLGRPFTELAIDEAAKGSGVLFLKRLPTPLPRHSCVHQHQTPEGHEERMGGRHVNGTRRGRGSLRGRRNYRLVCRVRQAYSRRRTIPGSVRSRLFQSMATPRRASSSTRRCG